MEKLTFWMTLVTVFANIPTSEHKRCVKGPLTDKLQMHCFGGFAYKCNNTDLRKVPEIFPHYNSSSKMCLLDLSHNELMKLQNYSFVQAHDVLALYLNDNKIRFIDSDAFSNLTKLEYINLTSNFLQLSESFGEGVFKPLINLHYINLKDNPIYSYRGLQKLLQPLKQLHSLFISGCYNCTFEKGFEMLKNLRTLSLSGTRPDNCDIKVILNDTFSYVPQIKTVYLTSCNINAVESGALKPLRRIRKVDISYNENLHFSGMQNVIEGLRNSPVTTLHFDRIYEFYDRGTALKMTNIEPIRYLKNLTYLRMDLNKIEVIEDEVFDIIPNKTTHIVLSGNRLTWGRYVKHLTKLKQVEYLDISRQHLNYDPFLHQHYEQMSAWLDPVNYRNFTEQRLASTNSNVFEFNQTCLDCLQYCRLNKLTCVCIPPKLKQLIWKMSFLRFKVRNFRVCPPSSLKMIDVSFNLILEWTGPVLGLENLRELNLAENYCKQMDPDFFANFNNLQKLNISSNFLGPILDPTNPDAGKYFKKLTKLENLDLSETRISTLPMNLFENLRELKYLNMSRNMLYHWNSTLKTNCLRYVGLSDNRINTIPENFRDYLDKLSELSKDESCGRKSAVDLDLTGNPIQCNCESKPFLEWLTNTRVSFKFSETDYCYLNGHKVQLNDKDNIRAFITHLDRECFPFISVIVSSSICVISSVLIFLTYRNRWKLRHLYYSNRTKRHNHQGYNRLFECDAFVSYSKSEALFIKNTLVPALEGEPNFLRVWVADRDSQAGASVAENITHAVNNCKKSVLILSKNYFHESWCNYEMNMARVESIESKRKLLIIVLYNDVLVKDIPLDYLRFLNSVHSIDFPSHTQDINTFWTALVEAIKTE